MLEKYARSEVLDIKSSPVRLGRTASLSRMSEYNDYRTDDDFLYVRVRAISSRVNKNNDGWPSQELKQSYSSFLNKPIFVDHNNHDPDRARGVIVDSQLHIEDDMDKASSLDPYYANAPAEHKPPTWIELLLETDAKAFPRLAKSIVDGEIDGVSMGCNVERSKCSICSNWATTPQEYCSHVKNKGAYFDSVAEDGSKTSKKAYEDCYGIGFFEISYVFDPADETALTFGVNDHLHEPDNSLAVAAAVYKEAGEEDLFNRVSDEDLGWSYARPLWNKAAGVAKTAAGLLEPEGQPEQGTGLTFEDLPEAKQLYQLALNAFLEGAHSGGNLNESEDNKGRTNAYLAVNKWIGPNGETPPPGAAKYFSDKAFNDVASGFTNAVVDDRIGDDAPWQPGQISEQEQWKPEFMNQLNLRNPLRPQGSNEACPMCDQKVASTDDRCKYCGFHVQRVADRNPLPQSDLTKAPVKIDTLRQEFNCPVCGSSMEDGKCPVCNFEEPPDGFDNPDLEKAREMQNQVQDTTQQGTPAPPAVPPQPQGQPGSSGLPQAPPSGLGAMGATILNNAANLSGREVTAQDKNQGGRINTQERPVLPVTRQNTDKPLKTKVVTDSTTPVESKTKGEPNNMDENKKLADSNGAPPVDKDVAADGRVDVTGVGGVAGDPEGGVVHQKVDQAGGEVLNEEAEHHEVDETVRTDDSGPTRTWHGIRNDGDSAGQQSPVTNQSFSFVNKESLAVFGDPLENGDIKTIDVDAPLKQELGDPTKTWGSDDFHITDPTTPDQTFLKGETGEPARHKGPDTEPFLHGETVPKAEHKAPVKEPFAGGEVRSNVEDERAQIRAHIYSSIRAAETEIELGITDPRNKWVRAEELENTSPDALAAQLDTLSRVRTASAKQQPQPAQQQKTAGRMPSLQPGVGVSHEAQVNGAESIFM